MSNIVVPQLGESVVEARVARWLKKEGDRVEIGEPVVELETEKIDLEVGAEHGGRDHQHQAAGGRGRQGRRAAGRRRRERRRGGGRTRRSRRCGGAGSNCNLPSEAAAAGSRRHRRARPRRRPTDSEPRRRRADRQGARRQPRARPGLRLGRPRDEAGRPERASGRLHTSDRTRSQPDRTGATCPPAPTARTGDRTEVRAADVEAAGRRLPGASSRRSARRRCSRRSTRST